MLPDGKTDGLEQSTEATALPRTGSPKDVLCKFRLRHNPVPMFDKARDHAHLFRREPMHHR